MSNIVFRVEHKDKPSPYSEIIGQGCYVDAPIKECWVEKMYNEHEDSKHPNLTEDGLGRFNDNDDYFTCFIDIKDLKTWFYGYLKLLSKSGYVIRKYTLSEEPILGKGKKQAVFNKNWVVEKNIWKSK